MGSAGSVSKEQLTEEQVKTMIERFCYLDENNDGTISLEELKLEHRNFDGDAYDEAAIDAEFAKLDANQGTLGLSDEDFAPIRATRVETLTKKHDEAVAKARAALAAHVADAKQAQTARRAELEARVRRERDAAARAPWTRALNDHEQARAAYAA